MLTNPCFSFQEKIKILSTRDFAQGAKELLVKKLAGNPLHDYFQIGKTKLFFDVDLKIDDYNVFLKGIAQVLTETYVIPHFFTKHVKLKEGDIFLDLGASIGTTSMCFSEIVGKRGTGYAFEPVVSDVLERNLSENQIANVKVISKAVSAHSGPTEIEISDYIFDSSITKRDYTSGHYTNNKVIQSITLDEFVQQYALPKVDFIKVDIEGAEELAIRGAEKLIKKYSPKWSIASYHIDFDNEPQHPKLVSILKDYGYNINEYDASYIYAWK